MVIKRKFRQSVPKEINDALLLFIKQKIHLDEPISSPFFINMLQKSFDALAQT